MTWHRCVTEPGHGPTLAPDVGGLPGPLMGTETLQVLGCTVLGCTCLLLVNIYCLLSLLYLGGPSFLLRFEYSLCSSLTITGSVRGSFQVSRMDNKGKIRWDNGIINVISVKKENRDEASIFKRHRSWLFNPVYVLCNRVEV